MSGTFTTCCLGDVLNLKRRYDLPKRKRVTGAVPIISSSGTTDYHNEAKVKGPGVVTGRYGTLGEVFYVEEDYWPLNTSLYVQDFKGNDPRFISYFLQTLHFGSQNAAGAVPGVNRNHLHELEVHLPDLPTQRRIAGILSAYDDLIENNLRRIRILEEMAQCLYREWFVHFRIPSEVLQQAGLPPEITLVDSPLGPIPEGWEMTKIKDFGVVVTGKTPSKKNEDFYGPGMPFLKTPDMHGQMFILQTNESLTEMGSTSQAKKTLPVGSICVSCIGTLGVVSITSEPCQTNQQINSVVLENEVTREFLFFWLRGATQKLENLGSNGATMGNVNKSKFEGMDLVGPPTELLVRFHDLVEPSLEQIKLLMRKNQTLRQTRDLFLPKLLSPS